MITVGFKARSLRALVAISFVFVSYTAFGAGECGTEGTSYTANESVEGVAHRVCNRISRFMDFQEGKGVGELARELARLSKELEAEGQGLSAANVNGSGITFEMIRSFVLSATDGKGLDVPVFQHEDAIKEANLRLQRSGFDPEFIRIVQAPGAEQSLPPMEQPISTHQQSYDNITKARMAVVLSVVTLAGFSNGFTVPAAAGVVTAAALETQFALFSSKWATFFDKTGIPGNILINMLYPTIMSLVQIAAERATDVPVSLNPKEFLVKSMFISTLAFVSSFGAAQTKMAGMRRTGYLSEFRRMLIEFGSLLYNNSGRVALITAGAAGAGVANEVFQVYGVKFNRGETFGLVMQGAYFLAVTAPLLMRFWVGDRMFDEVTRYRLLHQTDPHHPWNRGIIGQVRKGCAHAVAWAANWYTPNRR